MHAYVHGDAYSHALIQMQDKQTNQTLGLGLGLGLGSTLATGGLQNRKPKTPVLDSNNRSLRQAKPSLTAVELAMMV